MMHQPVLPEGVFADRRAPEGVLLSVMNHVSERIEEVEQRHDERYKILDAKIDKVTDSIHNLTVSLDSWMDREPAAIIEQCEQMFDEAIPAGKDNPDATPAEKRKEHRRAHAKWMQHVEDELAKWKNIRAKVMEWAVIGGLAILATALWQYLLKGPK